MASSSWLCPLCHDPLTLSNGCWACLSKHSFDVAKEGYVNLLPAQNKKSRDPGDSNEMIKARRAFLNQGFFSPLADAVRETVNDMTSSWPKNRPVNILDCGCGEGYYTARLKNQEPLNYVVRGLDISKPAVQLASKSYKDIQFAVASAFSIPLPDESLHLVLQIFSPSADTHIQQKLQANGILVRVTPGADHLRELRNSIYKSTNEHIIRPPDAELFTLIQREKCKFTIQLTSRSEIKHLLMMTPHFWKASSSLKDILLAKDNMQLSADFVISSYTKMPR